MILPCGRWPQGTATARRAAPVADITGQPAESVEEFVTRRLDLFAE
jgi:hypothetical protein